MTNVPSLLIFHSILNCLLFFPPPLLRLYSRLRSHFADSTQQPPPSPVFSHLECVCVWRQRKRFRRRGLAADLTQRVKNTHTHTRARQHRGWKPETTLSVLWLFQPSALHVVPLPHDAQRHLDVCSRPDQLVRFFSQLVERNSGAAGERVVLRVFLEIHTVGI